jgi:hypothetical protein
MKEAAFCFFQHSTNASPARTTLNFPAPLFALPDASIYDHEHEHEHEVVESPIRGSRGLPLAAWPRTNAKF